MGPAGLRLDRRQRGDAAGPAGRRGRTATATPLLEMGGHDTDDTEHMVTEAAIRAFYAHYRRVMEL